MPQVVVEMTGEEARLWTSLQNVARGFGGVEEGVSKTTKASREAAAQARQLEQAARRVYEETRTPAEQHNARLGKLSELLKANKIDQETYGRAVKQSEERLRGAGQAQEKAFGPEAARNVAGLALGIAGISFGLDQVKAAFGEVQQSIVKTRQEAAQGVQGAEGSRARLAQLAVTAADPAARFQELRAAADKMQQEAGMSAERAAGVIFSLESAGMFGDRDFFAKLAGSGTVADPATLITAADTLRTSMPGAGTTRQIVSKGLAASGFAPTLVEQLLPGAAKAGTAAEVIGISSEDVLAATAIVAKAKGSGEAAGERNKALMQVLAKLGAGVYGDKEMTAKVAGKLDFRGKNLIERLVQIEALRLGRAEMLKLFGREEGLEAYDILLANRKTYGEARAAIGRAGAEDLAGKMVGIPAMDPATAAAQALRIAKAREAQVVEPAGTRATAIEAGIRWMETEDRRRGMGEFRMGVRRFIRDKLTWGGAIERADVDILRDAWKRGYFDSAPPEIRGPVAELIGVDLASAAKTHAEMVSGLAPWQRQLAEGGPLMTEEENAAAMRAEWTGKLLRDAAEKLNRAAERQNAAAGGPTLSKPDRDH